MHTGLRWKDQTARKIHLIVEWQMSEIYEALVKRLLVWKTLMGMMGDGFIVLKVSTILSPPGPMYEGGVFS